MARVATRLTALVLRRRQFLVGSALAALFVLVFGLWIALGVGGTHAADAVDDLGELVAALVSAVLCAVAARWGGTSRASWALLSASSLSWGVGEALWSYDDLVRRVQVPFPSLADVGFLAAVPLACAALLLFPGSPRRATRRVQGLLDGCIIATSLLFASWATILGPLYRSHQGGPLKQVISLAYPASDVVMASLVVILVARAPHFRRMSLGLVMAGVVAFAVADSSFSYLTELNDYGNGNVLDTGWVAGYLLIGLGALWAVTSPSGRPAAAGAGDRVSALSLMAPYAPVLVILAVTSIELLRKQHIDRVAWTMALVLVVLVLARELLRLLAQAAATRPGAGSRAWPGRHAPRPPVAGTTPPAAGRV